MNKRFEPRHEPTWMGLLRPLTPSFIRSLRQRLIHDRAKETCRGLAVEKSFETVYQKNLWGGRSGEFYSGRGSDSEFAGPYCDFVRGFIRDRKIKSVVDLGCGDFRVGRNLLTPTVSYIGVDVVSSLIERNKREFSKENISFQVLNAIESLPPVADLCLIRQVLQHLANHQVHAILRNCAAYPYLIISEHIFLNGGLPFNIDKPHGPDLRGSGLVFDQPPFSLQAETVLEVSVADNEVIRTVLVRQERMGGQFSSFGD